MPLQIAIIGLGRAGLARIRDLSDFPGAQLAATVSQRPGVGSHTWPAVCADPHINAVVIATENARHAALAEDALRAGKHVLVDYPLAATASDVARLQDLAAAHNRLLHMEAIGLLTAEHAWQRRALLDPTVTHVHATLDGDLRGWLADEAAAGRVGQLIYGRLLALDDVLGPLTLDDLELRGDVQAWTLTVRLRAGTRTATLIESRAPGRSREKHVRLEQADGTALVPPPLPPDVGLFRQDLAHFVQRVATGASGYASDAAILRTARLAEEVSRQFHLNRPV
jgi:predicted dehydrogenase